jgi:hypothetical protein
MHGQYSRAVSNQEQVIDGARTVFYISGYFEFNPLLKKIINDQILLTMSIGKLLSSCGKSKKRD